MTSNKPVSFDEFWRDAITQWERNSNEMATQNMQSPEFTQAMTNLAIGSSGLQKLFAMFVAQSLSHMNLPSRTEIHEISERLRVIEANLAQIQAALTKVPSPEPLAQVAGVEAAVMRVKAEAKPARTKKPPARAPATAERAK